MGKEHTGTCHSSRVFFAFPGDLGLRESRRLAAVSHPPPNNSHWRGQPQPATVAAQYSFSSSFSSMP